MCIVYAVPLEKRPQLQGLFGALFGLASVVGPLIGGAFTSDAQATWRWCFYINLPCGVVAMVVIAFCLKVPDRETTKIPWTEKLSQLDILGTTALIPGVVCLLLALQWGGQTYAVSCPGCRFQFAPTCADRLQWNSGHIIALITLAGVLLIAFVAIQILLPKTATIPPRIFKQRSVAASFWATIWIGGSSYTYSTKYQPRYVCM